MIQNRKHFIDELNDLQSRVIEMGNEVIRSYKNLITACQANDLALAKHIMEHDKIINDIEIAINVEGYLLIAKQCPVASDLRRIITGIKIANDLERIGDYSSNIAKYMIKTKNDNKQFVESIITLSEQLITMLENIMKAFANEDIELALKVNDMDEILDETYEEIVKEVIQIGKQTTNEEAEEAMRAILVIKQLERAGDHVTNIAESIVYLVNGKRVELN